MNTTLIKVTPTKEQRKYQEDELIAFLDIHSNTFTANCGNNDEAPSLFKKETSFNTDNWAENLFKFGFKKVILTAKLNNGICLWQSNCSKVNINNPYFENSCEDLVKKVSKSCKKFGLKFGIHLTLKDYLTLNLTPEEYDNYYISQLKELMTNYSPISEVIMDMTSLDESYESLNFERYFKIIKEINPKCMISSPIGPDVRWMYYSDVKALKTSFYSSVNLDLLKEDLNNEEVRNGDIHGDTWIVGESIYSLSDCVNHKENALSILKHVYNNSLGRNTNLILVLSPNTDGLLNGNDIRTLSDFSKYIKETFSNNLIKGSSILATNSSSSDSYNLIDDYKKSYWIANENAVNPYIEIDFKTVTEFNILEIREWIAEGQNVEEFKVYAYNNGWFELYNGSSIGYRHIAKLNNIKTDKIKISFTKYKNPPMINHIGAYIG
ncbi:alpha-L-fucosidase [Clostridium sp. LIBA-8841]|uniref:alpha-L-fucosidase n=1 Tax=Clostridium sp. LIBA-8841 TaxID=2987530 RepID=UPI002AC45988|nr:alpha-L-fucosidase [Clostridium sp. LIBA-8841]MDZ5254187.1 alpha-L-fucosidase [Clostridium sp. LIBA-8841]